MLWFWNRQPCLSGMFDAQAHPSTLNFYGESNYSRLFKEMNVSPIMFYSIMQCCFCKGSLSFLCCLCWLDSSGVVLHHFLADRKSVCLSLAYQLQQMCMFEDICSFSLMVYNPHARDQHALYLCSLNWRQSWVIRGTTLPWRTMSLEWLQKRSPSGLSWMTPMTFWARP